MTNVHPGRVRHYSSHSVVISSLRLPRARGLEGELYRGLGSPRRLALEVKGYTNTVDSLERLGNTAVRD